MPDKKRNIIGAITAMLAGFGFLFLGLWMNKLLVAYEYSYWLFAFTKIIILLLSVLMLFIFVFLVGRGARNKRLTHILVVLVSSFSIFILVEIAFSFVVQSSGMGFGLSNQIWLKMYFNPVNSLGYRDKEPVACDGKKNILVVGDSFVAGHGIRNNEMFTELMKTKLSEEYSIYNLGMCGADTDTEFKNLLRYPVKPDIVILCYYHNDIATAMEATSFICNVNNPYEELNGIEKFIVDYSLFINYFYTDFASKMISQQFKESKTNDILAYQNLDVWNKQESILNLFSEYATQGEIRLIIVFFPSMSETMLVSHQLAGLKIMDYCEKRNLEFLNIFELIKDTPVDKRIVNRRDSHPSSFVNTIVADKLSAIITYEK